jgi:quinol monooxygenase YgiN
MKLVTGIWKNAQTEIDKFKQMCDVAKTFAVKETGCISFLFAQDGTTPNQFVFLEEWKDQKAIDFHIEQWYFKEFMQKSEPMLLSKAVIKIYDVEHIKEL